MEEGIFSRKALLHLRSVGVAKLLSVQSVLESRVGSSADSSLPEVNPRADQSAPQSPTAESPELARTAAVDPCERSMSPIADGGESPVHYSFSSPLPERTCEEAEQIAGGDCAYYSPFGASSLPDEISEDDLAQRFVESMQLDSTVDTVPQVMGRLVLRSKVSGMKQTSASEPGFRAGRSYAHAQIASWLQNEHLRYRASVVLLSDRSRKRAMETVIQHFAGLVVEHRRKDGGTGLLALRGDSRNVFQQGRGLLMLASKSQLENWAAVLRQHAQLRLLCYTDSIEKRRVMGSQKLRAFDVILTTLDILKATELALPEHELKTWAKQVQGEEEKEAIQQGDDVGWVTGGRAQAFPESIVSISQLHLFHWAMIVVDTHELGASATIKASSLRGKAFAKVSADSKLGLVDASGTTGEPFGPAARHMKEVLGLAAPVASVTLDARL